MGGLALSLRRGFVAVLGIAVVAGGCALYLHSRAAGEQAAERRALDARALELAARALAPGSAIACLDGEAGETVESACEKLVFARPETIAAAVAYVGARLSLLVDGLRYAGQGDPAFAAKLSGMRRAIELDRYGIAAHILSTQQGCNPDNCASFVFMRDTGALKANIRAHAFENYVARYAPGWSEDEKAPVTAKPAAQPAPPPVASAPASGSPLSSRYDFPSAASIPPVSIMNAEPPLPKPEQPVAADTGEKSDAPLPVPPKRPQSQAAAPPAPPAR